MTITLNIPPEKEAQLRANAAAHGQDVAEYVLSVALPEQSHNTPVAPPPYDPAAVIALLDSWMAEEDETAIQEQRDTLEYLQRVIDEDRPGQRSIFGTGYKPPDKLDTWVEP